MNVSPPQTRIQKKNREKILNAALEVFSSEGFRGATVDQIAGAAGLSKPNLLYYFPTKEAIYSELISTLLETWLDPLHAVTEDAENPVEEIVEYMLRKFQMSREFPRESRLFANEILRGAPRILDQIEGPLRQLVHDKAALFETWSSQNRLAKINGVHLIFSIWATTQHYADFDAQIQGILPDSDGAHLDDAARFLTDFYRRALTPG